MSTLDLINAIEVGDATSIETAFNDVMSSKVSEKLDTMRNDMAQTMFASQEESSTEETIEDETVVEEETELTDEEIDALLEEISEFGNVSDEELDSFVEDIYSATAARAGKDIGKPGKNFAKIAAKAGAKYGSKERGEKVAGAILAKIRAKHAG